MTATQPRTQQEQEVKLLHHTAEFLLFEMLKMKLDLAALRRLSVQETERELNDFFRRMVKIFPAEQQSYLNGLYEGFVQTRQPPYR